MSKPAADSYDFAAYLDAWRQLREEGTRLFAAERWAWEFPRPDAVNCILSDFEGKLRTLRQAAAALTGGPEPSDASRKG